MTSLPPEQDPDERRGRIALALGRIDEAIRHLSVAARSRPDRIELAFEVANLRFARGMYLDAADEYEAIIARAPEHDGPHENLLRALLNAGRPRQSVAAAERAFLATGRPEFVSRGLIASNYLDDLSPIELLDRHQRGGALIARAAGASARPVPEPRRDDPLRIGLLSGDLFEHPVARFVEPLMQALDRDRFRLVIFSNSDHADATTARLRTLAEAWHELHRVPDDHAASLIRDASVDVLVDLGGHVPNGRPGILTRTPAPVLVTWLGYPNTTGIPGVDWRIVDDVTDPPDRSWATERLLRIEAPFLCYRGPADPPRARSLRRGESLVMGSFNNLVKISDSCVRLWASAMRAVPGSRLLLKSRGLECLRTRAWIEQRFRDEGVEPDRLELRGWCDGLAAHYQSYDEVDIALDAFPYHGTTTTCDALWSGVPVVSRVGEDHRSRVGATLLAAVDLPDLAVPDDAGFTQAVVSLARDADRRRLLRDQLRSRIIQGPLGDASSFARRFGRALERICGRSDASGSIGNSRRRAVGADDALGADDDIPDAPPPMTP